MDLSNVAATFAFSTPLALGFAALGSGIGIGLAVKAALEASARQPQMYGKLLTMMIIGAALIEALTIYALIVFLITYGKG